MCDMHSHTPKCQINWKEDVQAQPYLEESLAMNNSKYIQGFIGYTIGSMLFWYISYINLDAVLLLLNFVEQSKNNYYFEEENYQ